MDMLAPDDSQLYSQLALLVHTEAQRRHCAGVPCFTVA